MPTAIERAVQTYIRAWSDSAARDALLEACWADDGRLVTTGREYRGRTELAAFMTSFAPKLKRIRLLSVIHGGVTSFRFRGAADLHDGTSPEAFDAGEIGADGRISFILTFAGPLLDAAT